MFICMFFLKSSYYASVGVFILKRAGHLDWSLTNQ